jgi:hypothetical protein
MAEDCEVFDADISTGCHSFTNSILTDFTTHGVDKKKCICEAGKSYDYISGTCTTSDVNRCSDENAHSCTFSGFAYTGRCVPNAILNDEGQCACNVGYYEDNNQGENRDRCQQCSTPHAPCFGPDPNIDQGALPFDM